MSAKPIAEMFSRLETQGLPNPLVAASGDDPDRGKAWRDRGAAAGISLSPRELQCLGELARGLQDAQIAEVLSISRPTVRLHLANARRKLKSATREQAIARAVALGLIEP